MLLKIHLHATHVYRTDALRLKSANRLYRLTLVVINIALALRIDCPRPGHKLTIDMSPTLDTRHGDKKLVGNTGAALRHQDGVCAQTRISGRNISRRLGLGLGSHHQRGPVRGGRTGWRRACA